MKVEGARCDGNLADVTPRVLAGECKDFLDNPTCKNDGPCLDHGGFDFAAQNLVSRTPTGGLRIDFPVGYDEDIGACSTSSVRAAERVRRSARHRARELRSIEPGCLHLAAEHQVRRWRSCTQKPGTRFRRGGLATA